MPTGRQASASYGGRDRSETVPYELFGNLIELFGAGHEAGETTDRGSMPNGYVPGGQLLTGVIFVGKNFPSPGFAFISPFSTRILPLCIEKTGIPKHLLPS